VLRQTSTAYTPTGKISTTTDANSNVTHYAYDAPAAAAPTGGSVTFAHRYNKANQRIGQTATDNSWFNYPAATPGTVFSTSFDPTPWRGSMIGRIRRSIVW
jgi:YD repeat-containing protein